MHTHVYINYLSLHEKKLLQGDKKIWTNRAGKNIHPLKINHILVL